MKRDVAVPYTTEICCPISRFLDYRQDLGVALKALCVSMSFHVAEITREGEVLVGCNTLVTEEENQIIVQRLLDRSECHIV